MHPKGIHPRTSKNYEDIIKAIGLKNYNKLVKYIDGTQLYVPMSKTICKDIRNTLIKKEFDGGNYKELAFKHKLTQKTVRNIINQK